MTQNDIELHNVSKQYGNLTVVDDISVAVPKGKFVSILGPSGCGKSTTLNMIAGFQEPNDGSIDFRGVNQVGVPPEKRDIGLVFQNYALFPHMTVAENVGFGLKMQNKSTADIASGVEKSLQIVHLEEFADRYPKELSGGQQQRVALARAIAPQPSVLLLDEPLSNLDLKLREQMRIELKEIQQELGMTFVYVTHDQEEAMAMSDHIVVMSKGKVVQQGSPDSIYREPTTRIVADFIGRSNIFEVLPCGQDGEYMQLKVTTGALTLLTSNTEKTARNDIKYVCIRPERILLFDPKIHTDDARNIVDGKVTSIVYLGAHSEVRCDIGSDIILTSQIRASQAREIEVGQNISLTFTPAAVWPLAE